MAIKLATLISRISFTTYEKDATRSTGEKVNIKLDSIVKKVTQPDQIGPMMEQMTPHTLLRYSTTTNIAI